MENQNLISKLNHDLNFFDFTGQVYAITGGGGCDFRRLQAIVLSIGRVVVVVQWLRVRVGGRMAIAFEETATVQAQNDEEQQEQTEANGQYHDPERYRFECVQIDQVHFGGGVDQGGRQEARIHVVLQLLDACDQERGDRKFGLVDLA